MATELALPGNRATGDELRKAVRPALLTVKARLATDIVGDDASSSTPDPTMSAAGIKRRRSDRPQSRDCGL